MLGRDAGMVLGQVETLNPNMTCWVAPREAFPPHVRKTSCERVAGRLATRRTHLQPRAIGSATAEPAIAYVRNL
eukprot:350486-Chlamydomonas_euryale.AAC.5